MSFFARDSELYDFVRGPTVYRYTSDDRPLIVAGQTYLAYALKRGAVSESADLTRNTLDITVPLALPLLELFRPVAPLDPIGITLSRRRKGSAVVEVQWIGEIGSVEFATAQAIIHGLPPMASLRAQGLLRCWQKNCPLVVYSAGLGQCNASRTALRVDATITGVAGATCQSAAFAAHPDGYFAGGDLEWTDGPVTERRFVLDHVKDTLTLLTPARMTVGLQLAAYPGCDHTLATCDRKFKNADNYGGQPWIPTKNPFGGDPIYS